MSLIPKKQKISVPIERQRTTKGQVGSPKIFSYHAQRSEQTANINRQVFRKTPGTEVASRAARYWVRRFGLLIIIIVVVVSLINILTLSTSPKILPMNSNDTTFLQDTAIYQQATQKLFAKSILNRNKITVNTLAIATEVKSLYPELSDVSVVLPLIGHKPIVYIQPTQPVLILQSTDNKTFVVDENGRALVEASKVKNIDRLHLVTVKDQSNLVVKNGDLAMAGNAVAFIQEVEFQLNHANLDVAQFILPAGKSELDTYVSGWPYFVKFNLENSNPTVQAGTLLALHHQLSQQGITPSQYIDVRIPGRAYYK